MRKTFFTTILLFLAFGQVFAGTKRIYLVPNSWDDAGALFWVHSYHDTDQDVDDTQFTLTLDNESEVAIYYADIPDTNNKYIFTRTSSASTNPWGTEGGEGKEEWARNTFINAGDNGSKNCCVINAIASDNASFVTLVQETVYKLSSADEVYVNVNRKGDADCWSLVPMTNTGFTYNGTAIYKGIYNNIYGGLGRLQFKEVTNGEPTWTHIIGTSDANSWTTDLSGYLNKIYNGSSWVTYGRDITIYAIPEIMNGATWDEESHSLYANFKYGDGDGEWVKVEMDKTAYTYKANPIYSATMFIRYNVIKKVQFLYNDGTDHELYAYDPSPQHLTDDIDGKIFIGAVNTVHTWNESYVRDYDIYYDMNEGVWGSGWVGTRTYDAGDQAISEDVTKTDYNFAGWYDNGSFDGDAITAVSSTLADDITLYAKWTAFSKTTLTPALNPIICTASEGDVVVVTVSATQSASAYIQLEDKDGVAFGNSLPISGAGTYAIPLTSADAAKVNAGLIVSGSNYTISAVTIKYQKTLWSGTVSDNTSWTQSAVLSTELFSGLTADDFLGFNISAINDGANWHEYDIRTNWRTNIITGTPGTVGTKIHNLTDAIIDSLQRQTNVIVARYLDVSALYTYMATKKYSVTLNTNGGTINSGNVNEYTFGTGATLPTDITLTGHTFGGWYPDAEFEEDAVTAISAADYGNKTYHAKWTANEYTVTLNTNDGTIYEGNVTSYTYGVGATLPTNVILWNNNFDGWYDNAELAGDPITSISSTETGNKTYYAKWTSITKAFPVASYPEFLAAQEGDIIVVNVTSTQTGSDMYLKDANYTNIANRSLSSAGKQVFQLSSDAATRVRTYGVRIEGQNFTFDDVQIRYRKTLWTGTVSDNKGWAQSDKLDRDPFAGLTADDYIGLNISAINQATWHQYAIRTNYRTNIIDGSTGTTGTVIHNLTDPIIDSLQKQDNIIVAQYLDISALYAYVSTGRFLVIYHDGDAEGDSHAPVDAVESITEGEDETFTISKIIEYRMKVRELDHWYSLYLPFTVSAVKVWDEEDDAYYDLIPYYRDEDSIFYTGHYVIRTPELINDDSIATSDFNKWHDPSSATDYLPAKRTPYIVQWHHSYFQNRYVSFFGAADQSIPTAMTVKAAPKTKNYVSVRGNDAMVDGTVVDAYTLNGDESWERTVDKGESVTIHPFECYIRANSEVTNKYLVIRRGMNFNETPTDFGTIDVSTPVTAKMLIDGQLYIIREGKMYNLQGVMVSEGKEEQQ